jgi:plastocyanin
LKSNINIIIRLFSLLIALTLFSLSGCGKSDYGTNSNYNSGGYNNSGSGSPAANEVWIQGMAFNPLNRTITTGTKITWTNKDATSHTVTSGTTGNPNGLFDSGNLAQNGTFSYTFSNAGTYKYYCRYHSSMSGTITVQ